MNSIIVKLFVYLTEVLSTLIIGIIVFVGIIMMKDNFFLGLFVAVGGTFLIVAIFGFAAIFIEIHKDVRAIREIYEDGKSNSMMGEGVKNEKKNAKMNIDDNVKSTGKIGNGTYDFKELADGTFIATHPSGIKKEFGTKAEMYEYFGEKQK